MATTNNILSGRRFIICGGGMVLFFFLGILFLNYVSVGAFEDDVMYVGLGNELVSHYQYRIPCFPSNPLCGKYPPLYPFLLGISSLLFPPLPAGLPFLKGVSLALALPGILFFTLWIFKRFASEKIPPALAYFTIFIVATHADLLFISKELMSESLFFSLIMFCLWKSDVINTRANGRELRTFVCLLVGGILMFYTRSIGIVFIFSLVIYVICRRQIRRGLIFGAIAIIAIFPWFWWSRYWVMTHEPLATVIPYFVSYNYNIEALRNFLFEERGEFLRRIFWYVNANFVASIHAIEAMIFPSDSCHTPLFSLRSLGIPSLFAFIFVFIGCVRSLRKSEYFSFFMVGYLLLVAVWPWSNKLRFMIPVAPVLICYFLEGIMLLLTRYGRLRNIIPTLLCLGILSSNLLWSFKINMIPSSLFIRAYGSESKNSVQKDILIQSIEWVKENTPKNAIILVGDGGLAYYVHTGRQVLPYRTLISSPAEHLKNLYNSTAYIHYTPQISPTIKDIKELFPNRPFYQLDIIPKENLANTDTILDKAKVVFTDYAKNEKVIVVRELSFQENKEKGIKDFEKDEKGLY